MKTEELLEKYSYATKHDLNNKFVCAGFNDSHMHVLNDGYSLETIQLADHTSSLKEMKEYIAEEVKSRQIKEGQWIRARGWNHDFFTDVNRFPTRYDLDEISQTNPICIVRACGHACVVNSKALEMIGIDKNAKQVDGGRFDVDENGEPLGIFRENALDLVYAKLPQPTREELKKMLILAMKHKRNHRRDRPHRGRNLQDTAQGYQDRRPDEYQRLPRCFYQKRY